MMDALNVIEVIRMMFFLLSPSAELSEKMKCDLYQIAIDITDASSSYTDSIYLIDRSFKKTRFGLNNNKCVFAGGNDLFKCGGSLDAYEQAKFELNKKSITRSDDLALDTYLINNFSKIKSSKGYEESKQSKGIIDLCRKDC